MKTRRSIYLDKFARIDFWRKERCAVEEIILAEGKKVDWIIKIASRMLKKRGRAIISRASQRVAEKLTEKFKNYIVKVNELARIVTIRRRKQPVLTRRGRIGIISAGTSDIPVAEEARVIAEEMGMEVLTAYDVGAAGIHRLAPPLREMLKKNVKVFVVVAGMDGILPTIVKGLVDRPVIGVPTSVGYGVGWKGLSALATMLNSCAPGVVVVNIDNGLGAGVAAALIAGGKND